MILERVVRDTKFLLRQILVAFDHNISAADNLASEGTSGQVLTSNGPNLPPSYTTLSQWYYGAGAPAGALGVDGDFYLDTATKVAYVKVGGAWV